jgi:DNA-binding transcriptional ArsR family regulator
VRPSPEPPARLELSTVLYALADPVRLDLVAQLRERDDIACGTFVTAVSKSTLSHHFRVLREAGVIATQREGGRALNSLRKRELDHAFPGVIDSVLDAFSGPGRFQAPAEDRDGRRRRRGSQTRAIAAVTA